VFDLRLIHQAFRVFNNAPLVFIELFGSVPYRWVRIRFRGRDVLVHEFAWLEHLRVANFHFAESEYKRFESLLVTQ
jgi:hypothetical protein